MAEPWLEVARDGACVWCTLARPPLNLLDPALLETLRGTFERLRRDPSVRVVVLAGSGRAFTAGMDVRVLRDLDVSGAKRFITALHETIATVHEAPFPVIAALNGPCLGAGLELALACDLRVAATEATLGLPEVRVGVPSVIEAALLPWLIGPGRAAEMLLSGEAVPATRALDWGLVNRVAPAAELRAAVGQLVGTILANGPTAVRLQKELMIAWRPAALAGAVRYGINAFAAAYASGEPREGAQAFLEKRPPRYDRAG